MKRVFLILSLITAQYYTSSAQTNAEKKADKTTDTVAVHPVSVQDDDTKYFNDKGKEITSKEFNNLIGLGYYTVDGVEKNGKAIGYRLVEVKGSLRLGAKNPQFAVIYVKGKKYSPADLKGKTVVLNFWFTACAPCIQEMPELSKLVNLYKNNSNVVFLAITRDQADLVGKFLNRTPFDYNIVAGQKKLIGDLGIALYPTNVILSKTGKVTFLRAAYSPETVEQLAQAIIADQNLKS